MKRYSGRFVIKSNRIKNWDYSTPGVYFITICTTDHDNYFGDINNNIVQYSEQGKIAVECLTEIEKHFEKIKILESIIMPNHVHILMEVVETKTNFKQDVNDPETVNNLNFIERTMARLYQ